MKHRLNARGHSCEPPRISLSPLLSQSPLHYHHWHYYHYITHTTSVFVCVRHSAPMHAFQRTRRPKQPARHLLGGGGNGAQEVLHQGQQVELLRQSGPLRPLLDNRNGGPVWATMEPIGRASRGFLNPPWGVIWGPAGKRCPLDPQGMGWGGGQPGS